MKIHFAASAKNIEKDIFLFRDIKKAIHSSGNELVRDWIDEAYQRIKKGTKLSSKTWKSIYQETSKAVLESEVLIVEATNPTFAAGFQIALAIQHKKPTLVLTQRDKELMGEFGSNIDSDLIRYRTYTKENIGKIIKKFLQDSGFKGKQKRFNFFVDQKIYNYLKGASFATGRTKAEVLRDLVIKQMQAESEEQDVEEE